MTLVSSVRLPLLALASVCLATTPLLAQDAPAWTLQAEESTLQFVASLQGAPVNGTFERFDAAIALDPAVPETGAVTITVDITSATTDNAQANAAIATADWFAAETFGQAVFQSDAISGADGAYVAEGTLTIRDQAVPVSVPFTLTVEGDRAAAVGSLTLDRTAFGIGQGSFAGPEPVAHEVEVTFAIQATAG
ncbi:MAG: YceI family protein [Pseudomonadota bacterium]